MEHIAIDLGGRESQVCARNEVGEIVDERRVRTASLDDYLGQRPPSRVVVETCAESFAIADRATARGHEVRVVAASLGRALGVGARRVKTDERDARALSEVSTRIDLPSVHIPSAEARHLKSVCGMREALVQCRTKLINTVRGWLRSQTLRLRSGAAASFCERVRARVSELPPHVERQLRAIESLTEQIRAADEQVSSYVKQSEVCRRLMTVPGVGPVTATRFVATVDDVGRFADAHALQSYLGLTPGENSSSDRKRRISITKAGSVAMRWALVQAAWSARRCRTRDPMVEWSRGIEQRRGKRIAVVALARKISGVLFALWRDGTSYSPFRLLEHQREEPPMHG